MERATHSARILEAMTEQQPIVFQFLEEIGSTWIDLVFQFAPDAVDVSQEERIKYLHAFGN